MLRHQILVGTLFVLIVAFCYFFYQQYLNPERLVATTTTTEAEVGPVLSEAALAGKDLFQTNCAACHARDMKTKLTGPALGGVTERWQDYPRTDLYGFVRNSQQMIESGQERAKAIWQEFQPVVMTPHPHLSDADIENIIVYIEETAGKTVYEGLSSL
ncbi:MAG: cytochrome c [Lewinella sp.]|nr:cytochrome c [Lewinella sp.]